MFMLPRSITHLAISSSDDDDSIGDSSQTSSQFEEVLSRLNKDEYSCYSNLKEIWNEEHPDRPFDDRMILRFAQCSPGNKPYEFKKAYKAMTQYDRRYLNMTARDIKPQLMSKTLFPVPGLKTIHGQPMFYMRPARYFPKETPTEVIIDNLAYVLQVMSNSQEACVGGIGFLACMDDWQMKNFSRDYCFEFMKMLQGAVPARVDIFLIVNPPSWFDKIWKIMAPMLSSEFKEKVHVISERKLKKYLQKGFENYLPDETAIGHAPTDKIVREWVRRRCKIERGKQKKINQIEVVVRENAVKTGWRAME